MPHFKSFEDMNDYLEFKSREVNTSSLIEFVSFDAPLFNNASNSDATEFVSFMAREVQMHGKMNILSTQFLNNKVIFEVRGQSSV